jgi:hypothetical protein
VAEELPSKQETLSLNPSTGKKMKSNLKRGREVHRLVQNSMSTLAGISKALWQH